MDDLSASAALVLYGAGIATLAALGWQREHSGRNGLRRFTGMRLRRAAWAGQLCFWLAVLAGLLSPVLAALHIVPVYGHSKGTIGQSAVVGNLDWVGLVVAAGGIAVGCLAQQTSASPWRTGVGPSDRTEQVASGILAVIRNPTFIAMMALQAGTALIAPTWLSVAGVIAAVLTCQIQTRLVEKPHLLPKHELA